MDKKVFIAGYSSAEEKLEQLVEKLTDNGYSLKSDSKESDCLSTLSKIDRDDKQKVKEAIAACLEWAERLIVIIDENETDRELVEWEVEWAHRIGKPIIGINVGESEEEFIYESVKKYASLGTVNIDEPDILEVIEGKKNVLENEITASGKTASIGKRGKC